MNMKDSILEELNKLETFISGLSESDVKLSGFKYRLKRLNDHLQNCNEDLGSFLEIEKKQNGIHSL